MPTEIPFLSYGTFYHIYNRGNNRENIFVQERNYAYFMVYGGSISVQLLRHGHMVCYEIISMRRYL